jgi:hypothetical protein
MKRMTRYGGAGAIGMAVALSVATGRASADGPQCSGWEVEYVLSGTLKLADTPMGAADGLHPVGPGRAVVRFEDRGGEPGGHAKVVAYGIHEHVVVTSKALFMTATVVTDTNSRGLADGNGMVAEGNLNDHTLGWSSPIHTYRTDGTMTCDGDLCGKLGAPPPGTSEVHIGPRAVQPGSFQYSPDMKTFSMGFMQTDRSDSPRQTTYEAIAGREIRRTCLP